MSQPRTERDPHDLRPHPLIQPMPRWAKDSDEWRAFVADIREHGIREPLKVVGDLVVDGETRRLAAKQLKLNVPTEEVPADEALAVIVRNLLLRRNVVSKSALAYLAYPLMQPAHEEARERHLARLKTGGAATKGHAVAIAPQLDDFADQIGVGVSLFKYAAKIHEAFAADPALKAELEPSILVDGAGLGGIVAGIGGRQATRGKPKGRQAEQLELFSEAWSTLGKRFGHWARMSVDVREQALPALRKTVAAMPPDLREELKRAIRNAEKEEKAAA